MNEVGVIGKVSAFYRNYDIDHDFKSSKLRFILFYKN